MVELSIGGEVGIGAAQDGLIILGVARREMLSLSVGDARAELPGMARFKLEKGSADGGSRQKAEAGKNGLGDVVEVHVAVESDDGCLVRLNSVMKDECSWPRRGPKQVWGKEK